MTELVNENGEKKWCKIANLMNEKFNNSEKTGKQCRERWHNLNKDSFTLEDEIKVFEYQRQMGNKWSEIAGFFPGRNDNFIKNCFYSAIRRNLRKYNKKKVPSKQLKGTITSLLKNSHARKILLSFPEHQNPELVKEKQKSSKEQHIPKIEKPVIIESKPKKRKSEVAKVQKTADLPDNSDRKPDENVSFPPSIDRSAMHLQVNTRFATKSFVPLKGIDDITPTLNYQFSFGLMGDEYEVLPELSSKHISLDLSRGDSTRSETNAQGPKFILPDYSPKKTLQFYFSPRNSS